MGREHVLRITIHDCTVQTFRAGGNGGQNQNKRDTGVRVIHPPSGARGEARDQRSQRQNKRAAFVRMAKSETFQTWARRTTLGVVTAVDDQLRDEHLLVEVRRNGRWVPL